MDDAVDLNHRALRRSKTVRSIRSRSIWIPAVISGPIAVVTWIVSSGAAPASPGWWASALGVAVVVSVLAYFLSRWLYDRTVSGRIRRLVREQFAKADSLRCAIELRPTELWTRQDGTEITFPWRDMEEVVDTDDAIELQFRNGLVVARNRVFSSPDQRAEFLASVRGTLEAKP